ncbi:DUF3857 domain-containing protein [Flavobacterium sp. MFBS3-15]|uniref:DUF3857 domain-containing protein n=1 Tax=Flavobacterium sp. MFBS3-15 TaxID=2989816 RepID=UPI00223583DF|nr:DUF3857 domain-containing protein [Flavobacterium sp. MFBS3-15]MCW4470876.1 DUF3857 domain-containing protein [Flavobacterium sp. MFBS3-15]
MKTRILTLLFVCITGMAHAQDKAKAEIKEFFWGKNDAYKNSNTIPDKWKNESAVVIYKNENYDFHKFGQNVTYISSVRKRIKLLDQAAVTEFSEFSFKDRFMSSKGNGWSFKKGTNVVGIKVVKPDGTEREINVNEEAVTADDEKKIAISSLEVGDIIDFYYHSTEPFKSKFQYGFEPVEQTLGDDYPIMNLKLTFKTENDFFVNFNTYNGAPELKQIPTEDSGERRYELVATDIAKNDFPRWFYPLAELPCYKFQVYFARSGKFEEMATAYLPAKEDIIKQTVSKEEILNYYETKFRPYGDIGDIKDFLKKKTFKSNAEKVREVYYMTRHAYYTRYIEAFIADDTKIINPYEVYAYYKNPVFLRSEQEFINHFMVFLKDQKLDYDIIVATPRVNGSIKDLLIENNASVMLRVNAEEPVYLQFFTPYTNADQVNFTIEDSDAYVLKVSKGKKVTDIETIKLPASSYKDNFTKEVVNVALAPDFTSMKINRESSLCGHNKDYEQGDKMYFFDYVYEDYNKYGTEQLLELVRNKKRKEQYTKEFNALKEKLKEKQKKEFEESVETEYGFGIDDHSLEITDTGRFGKAMPFTFKETFTIKDNLIKKAGGNYVFEIGKLIGEQIDLEDKEQNRTNNIYMSFPRSFEEEISMAIPEGYTVTGLDKLNKKVENAAGGFVSTATVEGNTLKVKAYKYYTKSYLPNSNWKDMVAFLDAAYQFTQEKVLLKKN